MKIFEDKKIRTEWNAENEDWYFLVVDIVAVLTELKKCLVFYNMIGGEQDIDKLTYDNIEKN